MQRWDLAVFLWKHSLIKYTRNELKNNLRYCQLHIIIMCISVLCDIPLPIYITHSLCPPPPLPPPVLDNASAAPASGLMEVWVWEHFVLSLCASCVPPLSKPGESPVSPSHPHVCSLESLKASLINGMNKLFTSWGIFRVLPSHGTREYSRVMPLSRFDVCLFACVFLIFSVHFKQRQKGLRECWSCPTKGN